MVTRTWYPSTLGTVRTRVYYGARPCLRTAHSNNSEGEQEQEEEREEEEEERKVQFSFPNRIIISQINLILSVPRTEPKALHLLGKHTITEPRPQLLLGFVFFFETGFSVLLWL